MKVAGSPLDRHMSTHLPRMLLSACVILALLATLAVFASRSHGYSVRAGHELQGGPSWRDLGPDGAVSLIGGSDASLIAGRATALALDPTTCSDGVCRTVYLGAAGGGVWKTTDAGRTWLPLTDTQPIENIGALALDPQNPPTGRLC